MKGCKLYEKKIVLFFYDELDAGEKVNVAAHLQTCSRCRETLQTLQSMAEKIPRQSVPEPDEATLQGMRNNLMQKIKTQRRDKRQRKIRRPPIFSPAPFFQTGLAVLLLAVGFLLGKQFGQKENAGQTAFNNILAANRLVRTKYGEINPLLAGVEKVKYNQKTGNVEIFYTTVNDIQLTGSLQNDTVREMLVHAMLEKENPTVRLHAVKSLNRLTRAGGALSPDLIRSVTLLLQKEKNLGVRLQVLRLLKNISTDGSVKDILLQIMLRDPEPAMRIQAFENLTTLKLSTQELNEILAIAKQDSSGYFAYQLKKIQAGKEAAASKSKVRTNRVKIMRKE